MATIQAYIESNFSEVISALEKDTSMPDVGFETQFKSSAKLDVSYHYKNGKKTQKAVWTTYTSGFSYTIEEIPGNDKRVSVLYEGAINGFSGQTLIPDLLRNLTVEQLTGSSGSANSIHAYKALRADLALK